MSRRPLRLALHEDLVRGGAPRVDRDAGVIRGVKVLGLVSENKRRYLPEAIRAAIPYYEGRSVRVDHPGRPDAGRGARDVFGQLRNVRQDDAGELWGDLHYLKSHPLAESVCEAAERMPDLFGLSHNAEGEGRYEGGTYVVEAITEVRSVDLVADPATTRGLFEGRTAMTQRVKLRAFLEGLAPRLAGPRRQRLTRLLREMGEVPGDPAGAVEIEGPAVPAEGGDHEEALWQGFRAAVLAILDGDGSADEKAKQIKDYLKSHEKLAGGAVPAPVEEEDGDKDEDDYKEQLRRLKAKDEARDLCEALAFVPTPVQLRAVMGLADEKARRELIESLKRGGPGRVRTQAPGGRPGANGGRRSFVESITLGGSR